MSEVKNVNIRDLINVYDSKCKLCSGRELSTKPITTAQLKSLLVHENETNHVIIEEALDNILIGSVTTPDFNLDDLTLQERMELMLELRIISKGKFYNFTHKCDKCNLEFIVNKDLTELPKTPVSETEITINITDIITLTIGMPTRGHQRQSYEYYDAYNPQSIMDTIKMVDIATGTFAYAIKEILIEGDPADISIEDKIYLLDNMPREKFEEISTFFKDNSYGVEFEFGFMCKGCGKKFTMMMPLNDFFV